MSISVSNGILDTGVTACGARVIIAAPALLSSHDKTNNKDNDYNTSKRTLQFLMS